MTIWERIGAFTLRHSRATLAAIAAVTLFFSFFLLRVEIDTSFLSFVRPETRALVETIEDDFAEGAYLTVIFESRTGRSLLEPDLLHQQLRIIRDIEASYPVTTFSLVDGIDRGLQRVKRQSLFDVHDYSTIAEAILGLAGGRTARDLERVSAHFLSHPQAIAFYRNLRLASGAGGLSAPGAPDTVYAVPFVQAIKALVRADPGESGRARREMLASIRDRLASLSTPDLAVYVLNDDLVAYDMDRDTQRSAVLLGLMAFGVDVLCVWSLFRSTREVAIVFAILGSACICTFGLAGLLGIRLSFLHLLVFPILLGTGVDDSLALGRRVLEENQLGKSASEALLATFRGSGTAVFLTTFTTALAFLVTGATARAEVFASFFFLVSIAMGIVFVLTLLIEGALRTELARHRGGWVRSLAAPTGALDTVSLWLTRRSWRLLEAAPRRLLIGVGAVVVVALVSATQVGSEMGRKDLLQAGMPSYRANEVMQHYFGDFRVGYVLFSGAVENPELLMKLAQLEERLAGVPEIEQVLGSANVDSVIALVSKLGISITARTDVRALFDSIRRNERTADYAVDMSFREAADYVLRRDGDRYDGVLMRFFVEGEAGSRALAACAAIRREIASLGLDRIPGVEVAIGGGDVIYPLESVYYADVMTQSFAWSVVGNLVVLIIAWRRIGLALLAVAPIVVAVSVIVGAMPLFGVALNPLNLGIGAVIVGLGIDYPIHLVERHEEEVRVRGLSSREAMRIALESMGPHILAAMLTTVVGFAAACVLLLPMSTSFGLLTGAAILLVYLATLFVLPALMTRDS